MALQQRRLSLISKTYTIYLTSKGLIAFAGCFLVGFLSKAQQANLVSNGGFEQLYSCSSQLTETTCVGWMGVDSTKFTGFVMNSCWGNVPNTGVGYQNAQEGAGFIRLTLFALTGPPDFRRSNIKNRLKQPLTAGKTYCAKMYVNRQDHCPEAIDGFGMYFGDSSIDTIIYNARLPLTFLPPQVQNPNGNIINDEINWVPVTGTFVANGTEKYLIIGNFKSDAATNTVSTGYTAAGLGFSEYFVDAVSCIDIDLPAYAFSSNNAYAIPGNTVYLGRQHDVGIDEACQWFKLPNTTNAIDTAAGITITVATTTETYMVKQDICGVIKYDTVVVHPSALGNGELRMLNEQLSLAPNPASDEVEIKIENAELRKRITSVVISNSLGEIIKEENFKDAEKIKLDISYLKEGIYFLALSDSKGQRLTKKLVITR